ERQADKRSNASFSVHLGSVCGGHCAGFAHARFKLLPPVLVGHDLSYSGSRSCGSQGDRRQKGQLAPKQRGFIVDEGTSEMHRLQLIERWPQPALGATDETQSAEWRTPHKMPRCHSL